MAHLVSPGYNKSALINSMLNPSEERIIEFKGLNKRSYIDEGEMSDMWNLSPDSYPLLMPRKPRGGMDMPEGTMRPLQILRRFSKLGLIAIDEPENEGDPVSVSFYYDDEKIGEVNNLSTESRAVAINNTMCFFPEKTCIDITVDGVQEGTYRSLEANTIIETSTAITITSEDARIDVPKGKYKYDDAINIAGTLAYTPSGGTATTMPINVSCNVEDVISGGPTDTTDTIILPLNTFIEMVGEGATAVSLAPSSTISRTMPNLDLIVEWNNRLWGCSNADNTIYASKLGDPSNWQYFQGTSMDSYYAQQGTDEVFTGIAEYSGHLIFFKPNSICRVYGTAPSNYQTTTAKAFGVEVGSGRSVLTINDTVFYKSEIGIMAYQGGIPFCISDKINWKMKNVVAATEGRKYYASCLVRDNGEYKGRLLVFDIGRGMWHLEDDFRFTDACKIGDEIYCTTASADILVCDTDVFCAEDLMVGSDYIEGDVVIINPEEPTENYTDINWMAVFGPFDEYIEEHKIYSKLAIRLKANGQASANVYISINEGPWEQVENYETVSTKGDFIPIIPRRCDRYSVKVEGNGNCEMKSLTRRVRRGSFGRL